MTYPLNNVTTSDRYTSSTMIEEIVAHKLTGQITNAAVYLKLKVAPPGEQRGLDFWEPEVFYAPAYIGLSRAETITGYAVRSAIAGVPAQVTLDAS